MFPSLSKNMLCPISGVAEVADNCFYNSSSHPTVAPTPSAFDSPEFARNMDPQSIPTTTTDSPRRRAQHEFNLYYARQLLPSPLTSSSSYDYWWPYPPAGATPTTSSTPTTFLDPSTNTLLASSTDPTPTLVFSVESDSAVSSSSASLDVTSLSSPIASSSASESIISISALPPSNSIIPANSHTKLSMVPPSNLVYVVPICGAVGLLVGGITAWCVYGCLTRNGHGRRRGRKSYGTLEVGPEYTPPSPRLGEKEDYDEQGEWVGDEKHAEECATDNTLHGDDASDDGDECGGTNETERFLHPGSAQTRPRPAHYTVRTKTDASATTVFTAARTKSSRSSRAPSPSPSGRTSLFFDRPDSTDAVPWESLRHKSIKRGILERLRDDGQQDSLARRPWHAAHSRNESDLLVADAEAQVSLARTASSVTSAALSRALSTITASTGPGFRIMPESPGETPRGERSADVFRWPSMQEDKYTRVPARVARSRSCSPEKASRAASPEKFERGRSPDKLGRAASPPVRSGGGGRGRLADRASTPGTGTDFRNVLPQSPPRISSPVLDSVLCFTPIPEAEADATPQMASFASFGAQAAEGMENVTGKGERIFGGAERRGRQ
ncbi:hypothetical protein C8R45DRAFT_1144550 [Mycena sanguinolenta]|nr:hypothetical protein C8R45DRAFT_1144550 [Mycena sanguinolenta]